MTDIISDKGNPSGSSVTGESMAPFPLARGEGRGYSRWYEVPRRLPARQRCDFLWL